MKYLNLEPIVIWKFEIEIVSKIYKLIFCSRPSQQRTSGRDRQQAPRASS